jgi:hypothetical protein
LVGLVIVAVTMGSVGAQEPLPVVRVQSSESHAFTFGCTDAPPLTHPGSVVLARTGDTTSALTVTYDLTGPVEPTAESVEVPAGEATVAIELVPLPDGDTGPIELVLLDGGEYDLGDPDSATLFPSIATPICAPPGSPESPEPPTVEPRFAG